MDSDNDRECNDDFNELMAVATLVRMKKDTKLDPDEASILEDMKKEFLGTQIPRNPEISFSQESVSQGKKIHLQESEEKQEHILKREREILGRGNNIPKISHSQDKRKRKRSNLDNQELETNLPENKQLQAPLSRESRKDRITSRSQELAFLDNEEEVIRMLNLVVNNYNPPDRPCVNGLDGIIGRCSKPFEKQLTTSDVKDDQCRLILSKPDVKEYLLPLLYEHENPIKGIVVTVYDGEGKSCDMIFKFLLASKTYVLIGGWKKFYKEHKLLEHEDFVTIWMFRHLINSNLCFVINSRRLPVHFELKKKTLNGKKGWSIR